MSNKTVQIPTVDELNGMSDAEYKALESRARRMAAHYGLRIQKSRTRNPERYDWNTYQLVDAESNFMVAYGLPNAYGLGLDDIFRTLTEGDGE